MLQYSNLMHNSLLLCRLILHTALESVRTAGNSELLAVVSADGTARLHTLPLQPVQPLPAVVALAVYNSSSSSSTSSSSEPLVAVGTSRSTDNVQVLDGETGGVLYRMQGHKGGAEALAFGRNQRLFSCGKVCTFLTTLLIYMYAFLVL
jgi:WD40 repeat protein